MKETVKVKVSEKKKKEMDLLLESMKTHVNYKKEFELMRDGLQHKFNKEGKNVNVQLMVEEEEA